MNAQHLSFNGVSETQDKFSCFRDKPTQTKDLGEVSSSDPQLTREFRSGRNLARL